MKEFAELVYRLELRQDAEFRASCLEDFMANSIEKDILWAIYLFHHKKPKRLTTQRSLRSWAIDFSELSEWIFEDCMKIVGDINETTSLIVPNPKEHNEKSFSFWIEEIMTLYQYDEESLRGWVINTWTRLEEKQRYILNKIITGSFRLTLPLPILCKALSAYTKMEIHKIAHRLVSKWTPLNTTFEELFYSEDVRDLLAKPLDHKKTILYDSNLPDLGNPHDWIAEWKWDGIRAQYISRGGEIFLWSTHLELLNPYFPEMINEKSKVNENFVLDGVILPYKDGIPQEFSVKEKRVGKKTITKALFNNFPVVFMAFDIIELENKDITKFSFHKRRSLLDKYFSDVGPSSIVLSELIHIESWQKLIVKSKMARVLKADGIILKRKDTHYSDLEDSWLKWKVEPLYVDAILIYAHRSGGWVGRNFVEFSFALRQAEKLVTITKTVADIDDDDMLEIIDFVKSNTIERFGPVYSVHPELVFKLSFDSVQESKRHKSGIVLRNPQIVEWLKESSPEEINTIGDLRQMLDQGGLLH